MSRVNTEYQFILSPGNKVEMIFVYPRKSQKGNYTLSFCYSIPKILVNGKEEDALEVKARILFASYSFET